MRPPARPSRLLALCLACTSALTLSMVGPALAEPAGSLRAPDAVLPALGDAGAQALSPAAERRLGDRIMRSIWGDPDVIDDPILLEYVQSLWGSLLVGARQRGEIGPDLDAAFAWTPFLVRDRSVNAFALPGGYIGVHLGLMAVTATPDELASVLAHELSHVTQRHIARMMDKSRQQSWVGIAAMVLGAIAASRSPEAAQALIIGGQGYSIQGQLNFSRDMEREADRVGFNVLTESGYDPAGMAAMFQQLLTASRLNDDGSFPYLRSHPLTTERIGEARSRLGSAGLGALPQTPRREMLEARHALMQARSRVLMDKRSASLHPQARPVTAAPADAPVLPHLVEVYTTLVAATQLREFPLADKALQEARRTLALAPPDWRAEAERVIVLAEADLHLAAGRPQKVRQLFSDQIGLREASLRPASRPELMAHARMALAQSDVATARVHLQEAASTLQSHLSTHPDDIAAWHLISAVWTRLGQPLRAVRAEAEAVALSGDLTGAIDRVDGARRRQSLSQSNQLIELSVLDARARKWKQMMRDDQKDGAF